MISTDELIRRSKERCKSHLGDSQVSLLVRADASVDAQVLSRHVAGLV